MKYWILKTEPDNYSIDDLYRDKVEPWDGIRNFQARNFIRDQMSVGDLVIIYHSSCAHVGLAGTAKVVSCAYPDPAQYDSKSPYFDSKASLEKPLWYVVDIQFSTKAKALVPLKTLKSRLDLTDLVLFKQSRLSVVPVTNDQWSILTALM